MVSHLRADAVLRIPIRRIPIVVDMLEPLAPHLSLDDFRSFHGKDPDQNRHRIVDIEVITSPDDQQPMLVSECARYSRFLRREGNDIYFRKELDPS
jgi:hypothetical protein